LDFGVQLATSGRVSRLPFVSRPVAAVLVAAAVAGGIAIAQIEQGDRGVAPVDSSSSYEVTGVDVDVAGRDADSARMAGWREAQRRGWKMLYARVNKVPVTSAPSLPDSTLDSIVAGIVVEDEQISTTRYIARLGVLFDRARTGQLLGVASYVRRSAPMLTIPVMWSGGAPQSYELRTQWQQAWARFRTGNSPVDYVRPVGTGCRPDPAERRPGAAARGGPGGGCCSTNMGPRHPGARSVAEAELSGRPGARDVQRAAWPGWRPDRAVHAAGADVGGDPAADGRGRAPDRRRPMPRHWRQGCWSRTRR
jgi:hypothetical protein